MSYDNKTASFDSFKNHYAFSSGDSPIHSTGTIRLWASALLKGVAAVKVYEFQEGQFTVIKQTPYWTTKKLSWGRRVTNFHARSHQVTYSRLGAALQFARQWMAEKAAAMGDEVVA